MESNRKSDLSFSFLMMKLYGQSHYQKVKDYQSVKSCKTYFYRLLTSFEHAISETIQISDRQHIINLKNIIEIGKRDIEMRETFSEIDQSFISTQTKLILELVGGIPNNCQKLNVINKKEKWRLNHLRQIQYIQNPKQKELSVFYVIQKKFASNFGGWESFVEMYYKDFNNDIEKLLEYLRKNHIEIYTEIQ